MSKKDLLLEKIEEVKDLMNQLINEKNELIDPDIIKTSQELDELLNKYNDLLKKEKKG